MKMLFVGYRKFRSKNDKDCFVLNFLTPIRISSDDSRADSEVISVFTDESKYNEFLKTNKLMSESEVKQDVVGSRVYYSI